MQLAVRSCGSRFAIGCGSRLLLGRRLLESRLFYYINLGLPDCREE